MRDNAEEGPERESAPRDPPSRGDADGSDDILGNEPTKHCTRCRIDKPLDQFSLGRRRKDGYSPWCKECCRAAYLARKPPGHVLRPYPRVRNRLHPELTEKRCTGCGHVKALDDFPRDSRLVDGRMKRCRDCMGLRRKERTFRAESLEARRAWERASYASNRERELARNKARNDALREEVLAAYGHRCACCGEGTAEFLAVDHINGRGAKHLKELNLTGRGFYRWLKRRGFPRDDFRLLCHNCNCARGFYGYCPHERRA